MLWERVEQFHSEASDGLALDLEQVGGSGCELMNLKHPTTSLLDAALLDQTWIEAGNYSFDHFPDLNYNVSFSSSFQRI